MGQRMHRQAMLTMRGRRMLAGLVVHEGWPIARAAERMNVSRPTARKWVRRYEAEGEAGLADRPATAHRRPHRLSAERERAIVAHRDAHAEGPHAIGWKLGENPATVHRVLARHGRPRLWELDRATRQVVRYERDRPGELVHVDVKKQGRIPDGGGWRAYGRGQAGRLERQEGPHRPARLGFDYLHQMVDDRTRVAYAEIHPDDRAATAVAFTARAIAWFAARGVPIERVMTDNGSCYRSRAFRELLADRGIAHKRTRPYRPQTNGKVERLNLTLKHEWAYTDAYTSNQQRRQAFDRYLHYYNWHRPHSAHGGTPPMATLTGNNAAGNYT